jgi:hypothetical protein
MFQVRGLNPVNCYVGKIIVIKHIKSSQHVLPVNFKTDLIFFNVFIEFFKVHGFNVSDVIEK